ncbi:MAG: LPS-assembly protein [Chthoniobacter sp.]|jgi:hypothetical protein|nr:LPS-assembly protein [Chthoniobacter sp.]
MKKWVVVFLLLLLCEPFARAQFGSFGDVPIEINSDSTQFIGGVAIAEGHVIVQYGTVTIYCDYGEYNPETRDVLVRGNVRIYREGRLFIGERAVYNLETKQLHAADFSGDFHPFRFSADSVTSLGGNAFKARQALFTTSDSSKPDYRIQARTVRIYPKDRIIFVNATLYIGQTPVFWWPYLFQSLKKDESFTVLPGYRSAWGAFLLTKTTFPIGENWSGKLLVDLRATRGLAIGLDSDFKYGMDDRSWGRFRSYYADDNQPSTNRTGLGREPVDSDRYRVSLQSKLFITDDIYANIDFNKMSDRRIMEDFLPNEFRLDPQPDNVFSLTKWDDNYTASLIVRKQLNNFFDATERLPEFVLDIKRHPFFESPVFYESESGVALLKRNFAKGSAFPDYRTTRVDSFHEFTLPMIYGGWLSIIPRFGLRGDYYSSSGHFDTEIQETTIENILPDNTRVKSTSLTTKNELKGGSAVFRGVVDGGLEASFKFSREWNEVESRRWGLDGLRHVVQPYADMSLAWASRSPNDILQFDRFQRSTQLPVFDFPEFTSIDAIDDWAILRLGVRNRLQTKRDNNTLNWFEMDTFVDVNFERPEFPDSTMREGPLSNLYNRLRWTPLPWVSLLIDSQVPTNSKGFTEVNSVLSFMVNADLRLDFGHRYMNENPFFQNSSLISVGGYYHISDNWGISVREEYEAADSTLESQTYQLHRDLSSWVAALGFVVRDNRRTQEFGLLLSFTLKDVPAVSLPLNFDPEGLAGSSKGK